MPTDKKRCRRCGKRMKKGAIAYRLRAELISSYNGYISVDENTKMNALLEEIRESLKGLSEKELEEQVYKLHEYMICANCRDEIDRFLSLEKS